MLRLNPVEGGRVFPMTESHLRIFVTSDLISIVSSIRKVTFRVQVQFFCFFWLESLFTSISWIGFLWTSFVKPQSESLPRTYVLLYLILCSVTFITVWPDSRDNKVGCVNKRIVWSHCPISLMTLGRDSGN